MRNRREVVIGATCAALASAAPFTQAQSSAITRRNIVDIEKDPGALQALRDAVDVLRKRDDYGRRPALNGWFSIATYHSHWCFGGVADYEIHYGWWFLPWHRAYLIHVERILQGAIQEPSLTIPYWDWLTTGSLPKSVFESHYRKGGETVTNPLFDDQRYGPVGQGGQIDVIDLGAPGKTEQELLAVDTFEHFAGGQPNETRTKRPGFLEATPHTYIHRAVGFNQANNRVGLMTVGMGPLDPVFFLHHANIDRLWTLWLKAGGRRDNPKDPVWRDHRFAFPETKTFKLVDYRIADLLDTEKSAGHYRYRHEDVGAQIASAAIIVLRGVPISLLPATIRVVASAENSQPVPIGTFSTVPSAKSENAKMDVVLPINDAARRFLTENRAVSIKAEVAGAPGQPVTVDDFSIEIPQ